MRTDPKALLRGVAKLVAVVVAAGLAGALIGIGLAKLSGNDGGGSPALPAAVATTSATTATTSTGSTGPTSGVTATSPTATQPSQTTTSTTTIAEAIPAAVADYKPPRIEVLFVRMGFPAKGTGRAPITVRVRVTNRGARALEAPAPVLLTGQDEVAIDPAAKAAAGSLLRAVAAGKTATGVLHFTASADATDRLTANPRARLRIAKRVVVLKLKTGTP